MSQQIEDFLYIGTDALLTRMVTKTILAEHFPERREFKHKVRQLTSFQKLFETRPTFGVEFFENAVVIKIISTCTGIVLNLGIICKDN